MPKLIYGHNRVVGEFVASQIKGFDGRLDKEDYTAIGVINDNRELIAGVIFNEYRPPVDIRENFAAVDKSWATRPILKHLFAYPFIHLGVRRMTGIIGADNNASIRLTEKLGFKLEGRARQAMDDGQDALIYGMLKEECPWIKGWLQK